MRSKKLIKNIALLMAVSLLVPSINSAACTTVLVGKDASADGSTIIARNEDAYTSNPKYFVVHPAKTNEKGTKYVSKGNGFTMELPEVQYKYTATPEWTDEWGQYEEAGTNQKGVAMTATESTSYKKEVEAVDPLVEDGIAEDSMVTVVLPYIDSAKDGVEYLGDIVEKYGAAECNGVAFSDKDEVWYMEIVSGHHWVAQRIPDDKYAVVANQMTNMIVDFTKPDEFMWSDGIQEFVTDNKLNPSAKEWNVRDIFSTNDEEDASYNICRVWDGQRILTPSKKDKYEITSKEIPFLQTADKKITVAKVRKVLSSHYNGTEYDPYGEAVGGYRAINVPRAMESHIIQWRQDMPVEISGVQWVALGIPETSVYVPFYNGITDTPESYKKGVDSSYDEESAYWVYKLTDVLVTPYYDQLYKKEAKPVYKAVHSKLKKNLKASDAKALEVYKNNPEDLAAYLTEQGMENAEYSLEEIKKLNGKLISISTDARKIFHNPDL